VVTTIAGPNDGNFKRPWGTTIDPDGTLYVADYENHVIRKGVPFVPLLQCVRIAQQVQLSWSQLATNFVLETSTTLGPNATWTPLSETPISVGANLQLTYPVSNSARFYRLRQ
jgi:DNA-binding beta-propeller fold protein YncE